LCGAPLRRQLRHLLHADDVDRPDLRHHQRALRPQSPDHHADAVLLHRGHGHRERRDSNHDCEQVLSAQASSPARLGGQKIGAGNAAATAAEQHRSSHGSPVFIGFQPFWLHTTRLRTRSTPWMLLCRWRRTARPSLHPVRDCAAGAGCLARRTQRGPGDPRSAMSAALAPSASGPDRRGLNWRRRSPWAIRRNRSSTGGDAPGQPDRHGQAQSHDPSSLDAGLQHGTRAEVCALPGDDRALTGEFEEP